MKKQLADVLERAERAQLEAKEAFGLGARIQLALRQARQEFRRSKSTKALADMIRLRVEADAVARELGD